MFPQNLAHLRRLQRELTGRDEEEGLNLAFVSVDLLEGRDDEGGGFACAVLGSSKNVAFGEGDRDGFFLNRGGTLESGFENAHEQFSSELHVFELEPLGCCHVLSLWTVIFYWYVEVGFP